MLSNGIPVNTFFSNNLKKRFKDKKINCSTMRTLEEDIKLGYKCEEELIPILNNFFNDTFRNTKDLYGNEYCNYDFEGTNGLRIELKKRRNTYDDFPTTIIPVHKTISIDLCPNIFIFNFSDGIYYTKWNYNRFKNYKTRMILCERFNKTDYVEHYMIPIEDLIRIPIEDLIRID